MKTIWVINHYVEIFPHLKEGRFYNFMLRLMQRGYNVHVFTASTIHNSDFNLIENNEKTKFITKEIDGINITYIKTRNYTGNGMSRIKNMLDFSRHINSVCSKFICENPDIIYASSPHIFAAREAEKFAQKHNLPCAVEVRDLWPLSIVEYKNFSNKNPLIRYLYHYENKIYRKADALVFTMEGGKEYIRDRNWDKSIKLDKIFHINNGIDIAEQDKQREEFLLDDSDLRGSNFKVVYAGSIRTVNSINLIIEAAKLLKENVDIKFLIFGDGDKRIELERFCAENGLQNVIFKGRVDKKFIPFVCSQADVNIISVKQTKISQYGVSWNKLFDYMNAGKPIISTVRVNYDLIEGKACGISVEKSTPEAIAEAILRIYNLSQEQYGQMCVNAKNGAKEYDYSILTDKLEEVIKYAIEHHGETKYAIH